MAPAKQAARGGRPGLWSSLTILGLSLAWFTTYCIACIVRGDSVEYLEYETAVPRRLVGVLGPGVFGFQLPYIEVTWRTTCAGFIGLGALATCDLLYARHTQARYFALHVICNMWISLLCIPDMINVFSDPIGMLKTRAVNHWPTALVFSIHVYHMAFFKNLNFIDWLHHVLMVVRRARRPERAARRPFR